MAFGEKKKLVAGEAKKEPTPFDPNRMYRVKLSRSVYFKPVWLNPSDNLVLRGDVAEAVREEILSASAEPEPTT